MMLGERALALLVYTGPYVVLVQAQSKAIRSVLRRKPRHPDTPIQLLAPQENLRPNVTNGLKLGHCFYSAFAWILTHPYRTDLYENLSRASISGGHIVFHLRLMVPLLLPSLEIEH